MESATEVNSILWAGTAIMLIFAFGLIFLVLTYQSHFLKMKRREAEQILEVSRKSEREERLRIAADLHDGVCGDLSAVRYGLALYEKSHPGLGSEVLAEIKDGIENALENTRLVSYKLMPPLLETVGFTAALDDHFKRLSRSTGISFIVSGDEIPLEPGNSYELFRVLNEITTNLIKYGQAKTFEAKISCADPDCAIAIQDDGVAFDFYKASRSSKGNGLSNIASRLKSINARIEQLPAESGNRFLITIQKQNA